MKKQKKTGTKTTYWWFESLKKIMKIRYKEPKFVYLGEKVKPGSIILSNHEGTDAPMSLEIYSGIPLRMWGASEMNSGLMELYDYQTEVYYHQKKHWSLFGARAFCLLASPLTYMFYKGLDLISTYKDQRLVKTMRESINAIRNGESVVIYPEVSDKGYLAELEGFHAGFVVLCEVCKRAGIDVPIYVSYFRKSDLTYVFDSPVLYSELSSHGETKEEIADKLRLRCNELGKMNFSSEEEIPQEELTVET